jgi:serine protease Do
MCAGSVRAVVAQDAPAAVADSAATEVGLNLKALERQVQETLRKVMPAVVAVSGGSGVVVSEEGYLLSVAHVGVRNDRRVTVTFPDGRSVRARTLGNDRGVDAGIMKIEGDGPFPCVPMGKSADVEAGAWCIALGYPVSFERGKPPVVRIGRVLRNRSNAMFTDCTIMGGDSGGPVFDLAGNLIAISSRCDDQLTTKNIHVPVDRYQDTWDRLVSGEDFNRFQRFITYLGVGRDEASPEARLGYIYPDSGAEKAGLLVGDLIVRFDGQEVSQYDQLPPLIERRKPGDEVEIEIRRGDETLKLKATLGRRPD